MEASILQKCDDVIKRTHVSRSRGLPHREGTVGLRRLSVDKSGIFNEIMKMESHYSVRTVRILIFIKYCHSEHVGANTVSSTCSPRLSSKSVWCVMEARAGYGAETNVYIIILVASIYYVLKKSKLK